MSAQPHFLGSMTLKALLEDPNLKNPPIIGQSSNVAKVKKEDGGSDGVQYNYGSAFLGPTLWDKSYGMDLNLEYMDLDEFLSENDIPAPGEDGLADIGGGLNASTDDDDPLHSGGNTHPNAVVSSPREYLRTPPLSPSHYIIIKGSSVSPAVNPPPAFPTHSHPTAASPSRSHSSHSSPSASPPRSPSFKVDFQVSDQDLALTSIPDYDDQRYYPGGWMQGGDGHRPKMGVSFDPRKRNFSEEELKPQPIIKKSKKIFVPDELKDDKYWARRLKNNYAAKRSRDARRVKENQIALRAAYLEKENKCLKEEMAKLRKENAKLKTIADKYEPGAGAAASSSSSMDGSWSALSSDL